MYEESLRDAIKPIPENISDWDREFYAERETYA